MKILLDECVTKHLKPYLKNHDVATVTEMKWNGIKNGKLLNLCVEFNFEMLLTVDKNLQFQQKIENYPLTIVVLHSLTSKVEELASFIPALISKIPSLEKGQVYVLKK